MSSSMGWIDPLSADDRHAELRAHVEVERNRPFLVITNRGTEAATEIRVQVDGAPLEKHTIFSAHYRRNPLGDVEPNGRYRARGIEADGASHVFQVVLDWMSASGKPGKWSGVARPE